ncbi:hypothetical protein AAAB33_13640, partial [Lentilactobacillus buchneri]|uniref:hypothetical protein n=1 Tax=Lentilactobacillus buchneri TaxID=1581 RepID=UPI0030F2982C
ERILRDLELGVPPYKLALTANQRTEMAATAAADGTDEILAAIRTAPDQTADPLAPILTGLQEEAELSRRHHLASQARG